MNTKLKAILASAVMSAVALQQAAAHMEPKSGDHMEKCYGIAKAHHNDCATAHHSCAGQSKADSDPNEWVKVPTGLCEKILNGSTSAKDESGQ